MDGETMHVTRKGSLYQGVVVISGTF